LGIDKEVKINIHRSVASIDVAHWQSVVKGKNIYLTLDYLAALESTMAQNMDFFYTLIYDDSDNPIMACVFQLVGFNYRGGDHSRLLLKNLCKYQSKDGFKISLLVGGNVFANGENCAIWNGDLTDRQAAKLLTRTIKKIKEDAKIKKKISVELFKEYWPKSAEVIDGFKSSKYKGFEIDVNMVMTIPAEWKSMHDYLNNMKTKFRTKAKKVFKSSASLELRSMGVDEIDQYKNEILTLFSSVLDRSEYSLGAIEPLTFSGFKKALNDKFFFRALFLEGKMIGFSTSFLNNDFFEANYVGIDYDFNQKYDVYQRLLYDFVELAINNGAKELHLGRTSELIKSQIGAVPVSMKLYAKHKSFLPNLVLSMALNFVKASQYELRPPFKQTTA
jgi:hypothetical protein